MGNGTSQRLSTVDPQKQAQFQELHDISCNYLEHFEFIIESGQAAEDPRQVLAVLKANCQTAREQISKLPTKQCQRRRYSSSVSPHSSIDIKKNDDNKNNIKNTNNGNNHNKKNGINKNSRREFRRRDFRRSKSASNATSANTVSKSASNAINSPWVIID